MKTKRAVAAMLCAAALAWCGAVAAQQGAAGFYVGADLGKADFGDDDNDFYRLTAGYRFSRNFAAEISRTDFGDLATIEATSWDLVGVAAIPVAERLSAFGKLGISRVKPGRGDHENELTFGVGAQYQLTPRFDLRAEWQRYDTENEIDTLSVGVIWKF